MLIVSLFLSPKISTESSENLSSNFSATVMFFFQQEESSHRKKDATSSCIEKLPFQELTKNNWRKEEQVIEVLIRFEL